VTALEPRHPTWLATVARSRFFRAGVWLLAIGWTPLLLYVAYESLSGATGGNPVGLGLLMFFSTPVALGLIAIGVVTATVAALSGNR
jgi:hypothetical protein